MIWSRDNSIFFLHTVSRSTQPFQTSTSMRYYAEFKEGGVLALSLVLLIVLEYVIHICLYSPSQIVLFEWLKSLVVASLNPAHSFVIRSECSFREGCRRELAQLNTHSGLLDLREYYRLKSRHRLRTTAV